MQIIAPNQEPGGGKGGPTFTGDVYTHVTKEASDGVAINNVNFSPGARTFWHRHENGQILLVLAGKGWVQSIGEPTRVIRTGDTVWIQPGELHWHGATDHSYMVHKAISLGETSWEKQVDEGDYGSEVIE